MLVSERYYPFEMLNEYLCKETLPMREFSMSLMKENGQEIYWRYISVANTMELRSILLKRAPHKFDIGAVYNKPVEARGDLLGANLVPIQREFVIDIDMNDYDGIRTCCSGKKVCGSCWLFIAVAAKILDNALTNHFGFTSLLYVFSGRRGLHVWCSDETARSLHNSTRSAIIAYLTIFNASSLPGKIDQSSYLTETLSIIKQYWPRLLRSQDLFYKSERARQVLLASLPNNDQSLVQQAFTLCKCSTELWNHLWQVPTRHYNLERVMLFLLQPRLDVNVSKDKKHLLKAPFCIHQATGKVCCPLDVTAIDKFNPETVATIKRLVSNEPTAIQDFQQYQQQLAATINKPPTRQTLVDKTSDHKVSSEGHQPV